MTIQFHPEKPFLIAGGGFTGEVFLWDLQQPDPLIFQT
jgi:WD40 repeat protein